MWKLNNRSNINENILCSLELNYHALWTKSDDQNPVIHKSEWAETVSSPHTKSLPWTSWRITFKETDLNLREIQYIKYLIW